MSVSTTVLWSPDTRRKEKSVWVAPALENDQPDSAKGQKEKHLKHQRSGQVMELRLGREVKGIRRGFAERERERETLR